MDLDKVFDPIEEVPTDAPYPEQLLQSTPNAHKLYASLQSYTRQFVEPATPIVRWNKSQFETTSRLVVESWDASDKRDGKRNKNTALFSWSSSDAYIEARKRELQVQRGESVSTPEPPKEVVSAGITIRQPSESITNTLTRMVDLEANRFMHSRIQAITAHHTDEMSKQMHARKRRDHESQLRKLREKEEEYERQLQALSAENKNSSFFNALFGTTDKKRGKRFSFMPRRREKEREFEGWAEEKDEEKGDGKFKEGRSKEVEKIDSSKDEETQKVIGKDNDQGEIGKKNDQNQKGGIDSSEVKIDAKGNPKDPLAPEHMDHLIFDASVAPISSSAAPDVFSGIDHVFGNVHHSDVDDFDDFTSSPAPPTPDVSLSHRLMPLGNQGPPNKLGEEVDLLSL